MKIDTRQTQIQEDEVSKIAKKVWLNLDFNHPNPYFRTKSYLGEEANNLAVKYSGEYLTEKNIGFDELIPLKNAVEKQVLETLESFIGDKETL